MYVIECTLLCLLYSTNSTSSYLLNPKKNFIQFMEYFYTLLNRRCFVSCKCTVLYHIYNMNSVVLPVSICVSGVHCFHPTGYISIVDVLFYKVYMVTWCITWCQSRYWGIMVSFEIEYKKFHLDLYVKI